MDIIHCRNGHEQIVAMDMDKLQEWILLDTKDRQVPDSVLNQMQYAVFMI